MNTQIQEAAIKWWDTVNEEDVNFMVRKHTKHTEFTGLYDCLLPSDIVSIWIQEVVKNWWVSVDLEEQIVKYGKGNSLFCPTYEELALFYLKEHESKEVMQKIKEDSEDLRDLVNDKNKLMYYRMVN